MNPISKYYKMLHIEGISLVSSHGFDEIAIRREDALLAVSLLSKEQVPILGGDVYLSKNNTISPTYDGWSTNRLSNESMQQYIDRCDIVAKNYIRNYPDSKNIMILFVLVIPQLT